MRNVVLILFFLIAAFRSHAAIDCIVVYEKDGHQSIIPIKEANEIKFGAQSMTVGSYDFLTENVRKYEFADSANLGIEELSGEISGYKIDPVGVITFSNPITQDVVVYNAQGLKYDVTPKVNLIDISHLPADVYIVKIGGSAIKFVKK